MNQALYIERAPQFRHLGGVSKQLDKTWGGRPREFRPKAETPSRDLLRFSPEREERFVARRPSIRRQRGWITVNPFTMSSYSGVPAVAPVFASDFTGRPVIKGTPVVGGTVSVLTGLMTTAGTPSPTLSYQWWRGEKSNSGAAISGATSSTYSPTNADLMGELWVVETKTNTAGAVSSTSIRLRVLPAGWTIGAGPAADAGTISDPNAASAYDPAHLYVAGECCTQSGTKYIMSEPYCYGVAPGNTTYWTVVVATYYLCPEASGASDSNTGAAQVFTSGTNGPWLTLDAVRKKVMSGTSGFSAAAAGSVICIARGLSGPLVGSISAGGALCNVPIFFGTCGTGAKPVIQAAPQAQSIITSAGQANATIMINKTPTSGPGMRFFDIDLDNKNLLQIIYTNSSGTVSVGDVLTFSNGAVGTVKYLYTTVSGTVLNAWVESLPANGFITYNTTFTFTGGSGAIPNNQANMNVIGAYTGFGNTTTDWALARCNVVDSTGVGILFDSETNPTTKGDFFAFHCKVTRCCSKGINGAGIDGGYCKNLRCWFCEAYNCGSQGSTTNHLAYLAAMTNWSVLFCKFWMDGDFGSSCFVYHGTLTNGEFAFNRGIGARVGWAFNDGYGSPSVFQSEIMDGLHHHHNLLENIGSFGNTAASLAWDITCVMNSSFHHNITKNCPTGTLFYQRRNSGGTPADSLLTNVIIAHNVWDLDSPVYFGAQLGTSADLITGLYWYNNILKTSAIVPFLEGYTLLDAQVFSDYNNYYRSGGGTVYTYHNGSGASNYSSITGAGSLNEAHSGFEVHGKSISPAFTNASTNDYTLGSGNGCRAAGKDVRRQLGCAYDWVGVIIDTANPDIGVTQNA